MRFFACKHPAKSLVVQKEHAVEPDRDDPDNFDIVTYYLHCCRCETKIELHHAELTQRARDKFFGNGRTPSIK